MGWITVKPEQEPEQLRGTGGDWDFGGSGCVFVCLG